ncbi:MAG: DEAD/DEAH box helicase, partial [Aquihabitans sp.]
MAAPNRSVAALAKLAEAVPGGERRKPQEVMATEVAETISKQRHLLAQAGTGTGKSWAYLVPAILAGKKTVVATATKALQDQLAGKDLPFLQKTLPTPFEFAVLKGRSNYLCRQRANEVVPAGDGQLQLDDIETTGSLGKEVLKLVDWGRKTQTGDRSDLS